MTDDHLDDVLEALETILDDTSAPVATATEVADALDRDRGRRRVLEDLRALERAGEVASKKVGANARVWWLDAPAPRTPPETRPMERERERDSALETPATRTPPDLRELVDDVDVPGRDRDQRDRRRDALEAVLEYLRDRGEAYRRDFQADVYPEHPAEYETENGWWNAVQPALREVADRDDRLEAAGTRSPWQWSES